jgi:two-component system chemotaxis response regulator CheY
VGAFAPITVTESLPDSLHLPPSALSERNTDVFKLPKSGVVHWCFELSIRSMQTAIPRHLEPRLAALTVLVVDDDLHMRKVVRTMLATIGVKTTFEAHDGPSGLAALRAHAPDLVLVDWEMPVLDGMQFTRLVRLPAAVPDPDVPIIMLTGHSERWRVEEAARFGVREYLLKPVSTKALQERIVSVLSHPRAARPPARGLETRQASASAAESNIRRPGDVVLVS